MLKTTDITHVPCGISRFVELVSDFMHWLYILGYFKMWPCHWIAENRSTENRSTDVAHGIAQLSGDPSAVGAAAEYCVPMICGAGKCMGMDDIRNSLAHHILCICLVRERWTFIALTNTSCIHMLVMGPISYSYYTAHTSTAWPIWKYCHTRQTPNTHTRTPPK